MKFFHHKNIIFSYTIILLLGWVSLTSAHEVNKGAVALLIAKNETGKTVGTGSGFVVQPDGTLVTNYHVLVDAHSVKAYFPNGTQVDVIGIRNIDRVRDFAILELAKGFYSTLELGDSTSLQAYDYTSALGYLSENVNPLAPVIAINLLPPICFRMIAAFFLSILSFNKSFSLIVFIMLSYHICFLLNY